MRTSIFTDELDRRGYISKESILSLVSQEEIYQMVFGFLPESHQYVTSPMRNDTTPGCWFEEYHTGVMYFIDFGSPRTHSDCFNVIQDFFEIPNFYLTLEYIHTTLIAGKKFMTTTLPKFKEKEKVVKERVKLLVEARAFTTADQAFWSPYGVSKQQLKEDRVFPIHRYYALNTKNGSITAQCLDIAYSYNEFADSRKKLYFPRREGKGRFLTNCTKDDIGGMSSLVVGGKELIITKGYKDYRVLKNSGKNVVWLQNEGMLPSQEVLTLLVRNFVNVTVWFDNDPVGILASQKVKDNINALFPSKAKNLWLPEQVLSKGVKDPSDCYAKDRVLYNQFIHSFTL